MPSGDRSNMIEIALNPARCLHEHSVWGLCARCVNACPGAAISLPEGARHPAVDGARCLRCGQCLSACPHDVFTSANFNERQLLNRVKHAKAVSLRCFLPYGEIDSLAGDGVPYHLSTCLAALSPGALYGLAVKGECVLATARCATCPLFRRVERTLRANIESARALLADCGRADNLRESVPLLLPAPAPATTPTTRRGGYNARAVFHELFEKVRPSSPAPRPAIELRARRKRVAEWRRQLMDSWNEVEHVQANGAYRWPQLSVKAEACRACGTCMQLCPTGSIRHGFDDGMFEYAFVPGTCADCGLCLISCPAAALSRSYRTYGQPFQPTVCLRRDAHPCPACGMPVFDERGELLCRLCQVEHRGERQPAAEVAP